VCPGQVDEKGGLPSLEVTGVPYAVGWGPATWTYDAWNRLVTVSGASVVSRWYYDGLHRRIHRARRQPRGEWPSEDYPD